MPRVRFIPFFRRAFTFWWPWHRDPTIYIPRSRRNVAEIMVHENVHVRQWRAYGRIGFLRHYLHSFGRMLLESEAMAEAILFLVAQLGYVEGDDKYEQAVQSLASQKAKLLSTRYHLGKRYTYQSCLASIQEFLYYTDFFADEDRE